MKFTAYRTISTRLTGNVVCPEGVEVDIDDNLAESLIDQGLGVGKKKPKPKKPEPPAPPEPTPTTGE